MAAYYPVADYLDIITDKICLIRGHKNRPVSCDHVECYIKSSSIHEVPESNVRPETG